MLSSVSPGKEPFFIRKNNIFAIPILHYNMETAKEVRLLFKSINPDCVAVELAETMQPELLHAASRLPDISIVVATSQNQRPIYYMSEPCDAGFEALRSALEGNIPAFCIDLDVDYYPDLHELLPDPYAIERIGLKKYYEAYKQEVLSKNLNENQIDNDREHHMARRLKELSLSYDCILFVGGMAHIENVLKLLDNTSFPLIQHAPRDKVMVYTLSEITLREVMREWGWITAHYETCRPFIGVNKGLEEKVLDRQKLIYELLKQASINYVKRTGNSFPSYNMTNVMKYLRNLAFMHQQLMPSLYQILNASKGCVDHDFAYEVWELATEYSFRKNIDNLIELSVSVDDIWGMSQSVRFHLKEKNQKSRYTKRLQKNRQKINFQPPRLWGICSFPKEDIVIERFGEFLKRKGKLLIQEEGARTLPFLASIEEGIDTKETLRHWHEKKLYVKTKGKPLGDVGSVVIIFNEDKPIDQQEARDTYSWKTTWIGEHNQESDMAFYATPITNNVIGPGISRCEYGGFMMSTPPRRLVDVWSDTDYSTCRTNGEVLLMAAIDYSVESLITYVAEKPPRTALKSYAHRFGKKIIYLPIAQLSPKTLSQLRIFHVLDGRSTRDIAGEYIGM